MPSITNGIITVSFNVGSKDSSGNFTISGISFRNNDSVTNLVNGARLSCSLNNSSGWQKSSINTLNHGQTASGGSITFSTGSTSAGVVYCYLILGSASSGTGNSYTVGAYVNPDPPSPTYYNHVLSYNSNGGSGEPASATITNTNSGSFTATLSSIEPTRESFVFIGWSTSQTATEATYQPNTSYTFTSRDITLYAVWYAERTLNVEIHGDHGAVYVNGIAVNQNGEIPSNMTYGHNEEITIQAIPDINYSYLSLMEKEINGYSDIITNVATLDSFEYKFRIVNDTNIIVYFAERTIHTLSVVTQYTVKGAGSYRYLDKPILLVNLNGPVRFNGWYENNTLISTANPMTYEMPDRDVSLTIQTEGEVFDNTPVRQFALQNNLGEVYKLTSKNSNIFFNEPTSLGVKKKIGTSRLGYSEIVATEEYEMPQPKGEMIFYSDSIDGIYKDYYDFARFLSKKPITLWYKIPTRNLADNIFHIPVEILSAEKAEVTKDDNILRVPIDFYGLNFWQLTVSSIETSQEGIDIYNDSDLEIGVEIEARRLLEREFDNPKIIFKQNGIEYGACSITHDDITKIKISTKDKNQFITLYNGETEIENPFAYINFEYADGIKQFPFPKLKQGFVTIELTYDDAGSEEKIYSINFDKEYLSV